MRLTASLRTLLTHGFTSPCAQHVTVRQATEADADSIVRMSRRALGEKFRTDYIPGWLPRLLTDSNRLMTVAEKDNEIVGLMTFVGGIDEGLTVHGEAGRVLPEFQKQNLIGWLMYNGMLELGKRWPQWRTWYGMSTQPRFTRSLTLKEICSERVLLRIRLENLDEFLENSSKHSVRNLPSLSTISPTDFENLLSNKVTCHRLYPDGIMIFEHLSYRASPSNVPLVSRYHENYVITQGGGDVTQAVSVGGLNPCDDGRAWRYSFNFDGMTDLDTSLAHVSHHLELQQSVIGFKPVYCVMMLPINYQDFYGKETLVSRYKTLFGVKKEEVTIMHAFLFESLQMRERFEKTPL